MKRALGKVLWALLAFVVAILLLEGLVRLSGLVPAPLYNRHVSHFELPKLPEEGLQLDENPPYTVDEHGFWVASPDQPGINAQGFRSAPFDAPNLDRPKVMILGDHFAYGMLATPYANSFAARLHRMGYQVFNLGIPDLGTGHYAALAEHYMPRLEPDAVVVCFYTGNDYNPTPPIRPDAPLMYFTNAGALPARNDQGDVISPEQSYANWAAIFGDSPATKVRQFFLGSYLFTGVAGLFAGERSFADRDAEALRHLNRVARAAAESESDFLLCVVPVSPLYATGHNSIERALNVFASLEPKAPDFLEVTHYEIPPQAYFNNEGHRRYAEWLDGLLQAEGLTPRPEALEELDVEAEVIIERPSTWEAFEAALSLDQAQSTAILAELNRLRDALHELFATPAEGDAQSPAAWLAAREAASESGHLLEDSALVQYLTNIRMADGRSYGVAFAEAEAKTREAIDAILRADQRNLLTQLRLDSLLRIDTGYDPLGEAIRATRQGAVQESPTS